jgi:hypothetical protein
MIQLRALVLAVPCLFALASLARAEAPRVESASIVQEGAGWTVRALIRHPDSGWDHYASGWQILAPDRTVLALAEITHPHPDGEPIREELTGLQLPEGVDHLLIRVRCTLDGWSARFYRLDIGTQVGVTR